MNEFVNVLGFAGSLRKGSYNRAALNAAKQLAPKSMNLEIFQLDEIPIYNADVEAKGDPEPVQQFKARISAADALLMVTPEYNYSVSGVLKNAIDWASRPPTTSPLIGKPVAMMGASPGGFGTLRAQLHLRQICMFSKMLALIEPEVHISRAHQKFDAQGNLIDESIAMRIRDLLDALVVWTIQLKGYGGGREAA